MSDVNQTPTFSELTEKLEEPFEHRLNQQLLQLDLAPAELDELKENIERWPAKKRKLRARILKPMEKWAAAFRRLAAPLVNLRQYRREKKRLLRFRTLAWSSGHGFILSFKVAFLWTLNLLRILLILAFSIGVILLVVYGLGKLFS